MNEAREDVSDPGPDRPAPGPVARRRIVAGIVVAAALAAAVTAGRSLMPNRAVLRQPLDFSHRIHVEDLGAECTDCHRHVLTGARATIPNLEVCADCHEEAMTDAPGEARLVEHIQEGRSIPWHKIYAVPADVYFSHRRHAVLGELPCDDCHGPVGTFDEPVTRRAVAVTMESCMDCHTERGASNDCIDCHR